MTCLQQAKIDEAQRKEKAVHIIQPDCSSFALNAGFKIHGEEGGASHSFARSSEYCASGQQEMFIKYDADDDGLLNAQVAVFCCCEILRVFA